MSIETYAREGAQTAVPEYQTLDDAVVMPRGSTPVSGSRIVTARKRPAGVVLIAVLAWLGAVAEIVSGILVLTGVLHPAAVSTETAWTAIVVGVVSFTVSLFLFTGSNLARVLMTVSLVLTLLTSVFAVITHPAGFVGLIASGLGALIGLSLLYTKRANAYFAN